MREELVSSVYTTVKQWVYHQPVTHLQRRRVLYPSLMLYGCHICSVAWKRFLTLACFDKHISYPIFHMNKSCKVYIIFSFSQSTHTLQPTSLQTCGNIYLYLYGTRRFLLQCSDGLWVKRVRSMPWSFQNGSTPSTTSLSPSPSSWSCSLLMKGESSLASLFLRYN